jgi:hypothetical protein
MSVTKKNSNDTETFVPFFLLVLISLLPPVTIGSPHERCSGVSKFESEDDEE